LAGFWEEGVSLLHRVGRVLMAVVIVGGCFGLALDAVGAEESAETQDAPAAKQTGQGRAADDEEKATELYPSLDDRDLGDPVLGPGGQTATWDHALPFFGQKVTELGFDLPNPYGVSMIVGRIRQDLLLDNLAVSIDGGPMQEIDFVEFDVAEADNTFAQVKADLWLFPFMNVYAVAGRVQGDATVPLGIPVDAALEFLGFGALCPSGPLRPAFCDELVKVTAEPGYAGYTYGVGTVLAMGWKRFFTVLPITFVRSELDIVDSRIETTNISPRFGITIDPKGKGRGALFVGATYLDAEFDLTGSVILPLSDIDGSLEDVEIDYKIRQRNKDKWNYLVGGQYEFNQRWSITAEVGFGGSRDNLFASGAYRW